MLLSVRWPFFSGVDEAKIADPTFDFEQWYWNASRLLAATFHMQPSEIEALTITKLQKWIEQANIVNKE